VDGGVVSPDAFVLRFFGPEDDDRLLLINLGRDLQLVPAPEPLLAPPASAWWQVLWSSEDPTYGVVGAPAPEDEAGRWQAPGESAMLLAPARLRPG
jgi:maltooligosyltrehalose trehalohydrolase